MEFQVADKKGVITKRKLRLVKADRSRYSVRVDEDERDIGTIWKADGQVLKFRRHRLDGTEIVDRWFAATKDGTKLGPQPPYSEGFTTRLEALTELLEAALKIRRS